MARHLRRMRRIYAGRRQNFHDLCESYLGKWIQLQAGDAGMQVTGFLRDGLDDNDVADAARKRGVNLSPLSMHYRHGAVRHGLVMGYAASDATATQRAMSCLRETFEEA
jgi:GntR family transcriptional regulator/MocR family aminotransferase